MGMCISVVLCLRYWACVVVAFFIDLKFTEINFI